ncbi:MAG: hypothetical protein RLZZ399_559 [Verrucomicrobiota bacterium]
MRVCYLHSDGFVRDLNRYRSGLLPSHYLGGWVELEGRGHCVRRCPGPRGVWAALGPWGWVIWQTFWVFCEKRCADVFVSIDLRCTWIMLVLKVLGLLDIPLVHIEKASPLPRPPGGFRRWITMRLWQEVGHFHSISSRLVSRFCEAYRLEPKRCRFLPMAPDPSWGSGFRHAEEERLCLLIGDRGRANLDPVLEAMPLGETVVVVAAIGETRRLRSHRCFGSGVQLRESLPAEEMQRLVWRSRLLLFPSTEEEDGGNVLLFLEGLSLGKVMIVVGDCGLGDYAQAGVNCLVVPEGATARLRDSIQAVLNNPRHFDFMRKQAQRSIREEFSQEKFGGALEASIERVVLDQRAKRR